jgi:hypothetical protein
MARTILTAYLETEINNVEKEFVKQMFFCVGKSVMRKMQVAREQVWVKKWWKAAKTMQNCSKPGFR